MHACMSGYCRKWPKASLVHCPGGREGGLGLPSHLVCLGAATTTSWILSFGMPAHSVNLRQMSPTSVGLHLEEGMPLLQFA